MKAYLHLIKHFLDKDFTLSVVSDGVTDLLKSSKYTEIKEDIEAVEECIVAIYNKDVKVGKALILPFDCDPEDTVADFTDNSIMNKWFKEYEKLE